VVGWAPEPVITRIQNPDQWVVVTGNYIDCTVLAQYTHLPWLNPHSDRENGGNKFLWRAGIHLWDCDITTHTPRFNYHPVSCYAVCHMSWLDSNSPVFSVFTRCSWETTRNISSLSGAAQLGSYFHLSFFPILQEITLNHPTVQSHSMHTESQQPESPNTSVLNLRFSLSISQFSQLVSWWGKGETSIISGIWAAVNMN